MAIAPHCAGRKGDSMVEPWIDTLSKWSRRQRHNAAVRERRRHEEDAVAVVMAVILVAFAALCLFFLI
jgi:hypothetical protein